VGSASDFDELAASLRADAADLRAFVEALAAKLQASFPDRTRIERGGFLGNKRVRRIECELGEDCYVVEQDGGRVTTRRSKVVRGIALKNEDLPLAEWIDALSRELVGEAERSGQGRAALERLLS
jgi:hypothetical protein